jgi:acetyl-CoA carboxylase biotin carboxyl carrier protein
MNDDMILTLIDRFSASEAAELDIQQGDQRIVLRKESAVRAACLVPTPVSSGPESPAALPAQADGAVHLKFPVTGAASGPGAGGDTITSPIVATFYGSSSPDAPPFVSAGKKVKAGDTLCILEAMKMMNHLEAEFDCEILAVKAGSGDLVEYGQVLFEVKKI